MPVHEQHQWAGLTTIVMVVRSIQHWNKITHEVKFYITSLGSDAKSSECNSTALGLKILFIGH